MNTLGALKSGYMKCLEMISKCINQLNPVERYWSDKMMFNTKNMERIL